MKYSIYIFLLLSSIACQENQSKNNTEFKIEKDVHYFDFDHIDYYRSDIKEEYLFHELREKLPKKEYDKYLSVFVNNYPNNLNDKHLESTLTDLNFKKIELDKTVYKDINDIYKKQYSDSIVKYACIPVYRDILIFKKNNIVVGISKLCFDCEKFKTIGTNVDMTYFGSNGDFIKLKKLLYQSQ